MKWRYQRPVPQVPSTLLYKGVLFMVNDSGILISFDPATGNVLKQGRLKGAIDKYFASPVGADGKVWLVSQDGTVSVVSAQGRLGDPRGQHARRRGVRDAGACGRTALHAHAQRVVRVWRGTVGEACPERTVGKWCALLDSNQGPPPCEPGTQGIGAQRPRGQPPRVLYLVPWLRADSEGGRRSAGAAHEPAGPLDSGLLNRSSGVVQRILRHLGRPPMHPRRGRRGRHPGNSRRLTIRPGAGPEFDAAC